MIVNHFEHLGLAILGRRQTTTNMMIPMWKGCDLLPHAVIGHQGRESPSPVIKSPRWDVLFTNRAALGSEVQTGDGAAVCGWIASRLDLVA